MRDALVRRLEGVDTVVTTRLSPRGVREFRTTGTHPDQAIEICQLAKVRRLVLYHHAPSHGDDQMDKIAAEYLAPRCRPRRRGPDLLRGMTLPIDRRRLEDRRLVFPVDRRSP